MLSTAAQSWLVYIVAAIFVVGALVNLIGPAGVRASYLRWGYPAGFRFVTAALEAAAAALMLLPATRTIGLNVGIAIMLAAIATLIRAREPLHSIPAILLAGASGLALL